MRGLCGAEERSQNLAYMNVGALQQQLQLVVVTGWGRHDECRA